MRASKVLYLILNEDETIYSNKRDEPMIYRIPKNFINQKRFKNCKVAKFELTDIVTIKAFKKKIKKPK